MQVAPAGQALPQVPQLALFVARLTHAPPQAVSPAGQTGAHVPAAQSGPPLPMMGGWHTVPQVPQLLGSAARSTHRLLHSVGRVPRVHAHVRFTHCWPSTHALPQVPQLAGLFVRLTHAPAQLVSPGMVQVIWQIPAEQTDPAGHALPHMPQLAGLDRVSTQTPPHTVSPTGQVMPESAASRGRGASAGRTSPVETWSPFAEMSSAASDGSFPSTDASLDLSTSMSTTLRPPHPGTTAKKYAHKPRPHSQRRLRSIFITDLYAP